VDERAGRLSTLTGCLWNRTTVGSRDRELGYRKAHHRRIDAVDLQFVACIDATLQVAITNASEEDEVTDVEDITSTDTSRRSV
jgi:hypothetical protein